MRVDWTVYRPRINLTGWSHWLPGAGGGWHGVVTDYDVLYVFSGEAVMRLDEALTLPLAPGTCLWLKPGQLYEGVQGPGEPMRNYYIHFDLLDAAGRIRGHDQPVPPLVIDRFDKPTVETLFRRITALLPFFMAEHRDHCAPERVAVAESLLQSLLMELDLASQDRLVETGFGLRRHHEQLVMRVLTDIEARGDATPTVHEIAESVGYSPAHFARVFRAIVGQWPEQFLIDRRMARARVLLTTTSLGVAEIAQTLGYREPTFFSTQFRRKVGCSPRAFRDLRNRQQA